MEHKSCDPICVVKVDVNCCRGCQVKLKKKLLSLNGVLWVEYDSRKKLATVRGKCEPSVVVNCIKKMGKAAEVVSYCKDPTASSVFDDNKGKEKASSASCNCGGGDDESVKGSDESKEKIKQQHHMQEDYAPPPKVDESVCKDPFCVIHRRSENMAAAGMNNNAGCMYWNHPSARMGAFRGPPPPPPGYGQFGMPPPQHPYGYRAPPPPPPPGYGFYPDQAGAPGAEFTGNFFRDQNPAGGCNTM